MDEHDSPLPVRRPHPTPSVAPRWAHVDGGRLVIATLPAAEDRPVPGDVALLERFSALMAAQGWPAHVGRLAYDRIYAGERFGFAKRVGTGELSLLARKLLIEWRATRAESAR